MPTPDAIAPINSRAAVVRQARAQHAQTPDARFNHVHTRAFCVAKPAPFCAVFAVPPCDNEPQVADTRYITVQNATVQDIQAGDWAALTYMYELTTGQSVAVKLPAPEPNSWCAEYRQGSRWKAVKGRWSHAAATAIYTALSPTLGVKNVRLTAVK